MYTVLYPLRSVRLLVYDGRATLYAVHVPLCDAETSLYGVHYS
jgi:hypothetical protein